MKNAIKRLAVLGLFLGFCSNAKAVEMAVSLDAFYENDTVELSNADRSIGMTNNLVFSGVGTQATFQTILLEKSKVSPYIGLGLGYIPSLKLKGDSFIEQGTQLMVSYSGNTKDILYVAIEAGLEFIFSRVRWQLLLGYDNGLIGKANTNSTVRNSGSRSNSINLDYARFKIGTRAYYSVTPKLDLGIIVNYAVTGKMEFANTVSNATYSTTFIGYDIGLSLRGRFL
jgi:hypothetical protein